MISTRKILSHLMCVAVVTFVAGCSKTSGEGDNPALVKVGKSMLTRAELARVVPGGLTPVDSAKYAGAYIRRWIDRHLISDIASSDIDMTDIDRMVSDYRERLIEMEYRRRMFDAYGDKDIPNDTLHNYFVINNADFVLERPMLQGLYLKVPEDAANLATIRRLYRSDKQADIDRLEKEVLSSAVHYDYFRDNWVDWEQIELHIPYDFGDNPDGFLKDRDHFETTAGGFVYLLDIKDKLPSGAIMPYENAKAVIKERLTAENRRAYDASLMSRLYEKSLKEGKIQLFVDLEP